MDKNEYICDDREKPIPPDILEMTDDEIEEEYQRRFNKVN